MSIGQEIIAACERLGRHSDDPDALTVAYLSAAHRAVADELKQEMAAAGLTVTIDAVGNVIGRLCCGRPAARTLLTGSHFDTVRNGGRFDGRLGIVLPIALARHLNESGERLPFDLEVIAFAEEEGLRYASTFLGSSPLVGQFDASVLERTDAAGVRMRDAIKDAGLDPDGIAGLRRDPARLLGYYEVHIEQGPVLLQAGEALGVVTSIAGGVRHSCRVIGTAGHAGTVPMALRHDAGTAAAEMVLAMEERCRSDPSGSVVGTAGRFEVVRGATNVIPGEAQFTIDLRASADGPRDRALADVLHSCQEIARRRAVSFASELTMKVPATPCTPAWVDALAAAVAGLGLPVRRMPSGAGHDAMMMGRAMPMAMLFVRCGNGGVSHSPAETMSAEDADQAAAATLAFWRGLGAAAQDAPDGARE